MILKINNKLKIFKYYIYMKINTIINKNLIIYLLLSSNINIIHILFE
jgi:hypothetical protein